MTLNVPVTKGPQTLLVYHSSLNEEPGYRIRIGIEEVFIAEHDADKLARYMLFDKPDIEEDTQPAGT